MKILAILAAVVLAGCVEGGSGSYTFTKNVKTGDVGVRVVSNKDTVLESLTFNPDTGTIEIKGLNSNGSNLGSLQLQLLLAQTRMAEALLSRAIGVAAPVTTLAPAE